MYKHTNYFLKILYFPSVIYIKLSSIRLLIYNYLLPKKDSRALEEKIKRQWEFEKGIDPYIEQDFKRYLSGQKKK